MLPQVVFSSSSMSSLTISLRFLKDHVAGDSPRNRDGYSWAHRVGPNTNWPHTCSNSSKLQGCHPWASTCGTAGWVRCTNPWGTRWLGSGSRWITGSCPSFFQTGGQSSRKNIHGNPWKKNKDQDMGFQPPTSPPPQRLSRLAADQRLRRTMQPRANGTFKVPKIIRNKWANLATRDEVFALFEKSGYDADSCFENLQLFSKGLVVSVDVWGFVSFIYIYQKTPQQNEWIVFPVYMFTYIYISLFV